jgi:hypothetical protein
MNKRQARAFVRELMTEHACDVEYLTLSEVYAGKFDEDMPEEVGAALSEAIQSARVLVVWDDA